MANETEIKESEDKKFTDESVRSLGTAIGNFIPTYKKFATACRQGLNSCLLFFSGGKYCVGNADIFKMDEPESVQSEVFIGWFRIYKTKRIKDKKYKGDPTNCLVKMEINPGETPKVTVNNSVTGDDISGDFSEATFKAIADFIS